MMLWMSLGLALPVLAAFMLVRRVRSIGAGSAVLAGGLALGLGTGLSAASFVAWRLVTPAEWLPAFPWVEATAWILVAVAAWRVDRTRDEAEQRHWSRLDSGLLLALVAVACLCLAYVVLHFLRFPHGEWDAWAIWNLKARFMVRGGSHWQDLFTTALPHPGYPLLVPGAVARLWLWSASESPVAGVTVAAVFACSIPAVVVGSLAHFRGWTPALWGGLLVIAGAPLSYYGAFQVADVPLGFFILVSVVLTAFDTTREHRWRFAAGVGLAVGLTGLVKDEGQVFMVGMTLAYVGYQLAGGRHSFGDRMVRVAGFVAAALPFWIVLMITKWAAPDVGLGAAFFSDEAWGKVTDAGRHQQIITAFVRTTWGWAGGWFFGAVPVFAAALMIGGWSLERRLRDSAAFAAAAMVMMLGSYYAAYVVSPYELSWHIPSSLHRILVQIWPTFVWTFCLVVSFDPDARS